MRVIFAGTGDIGIPTLNYLMAHHTLAGVLTQPDRPAGRHRDLKAPAIKEEILKLAPEIPMLQPESPRLPEAISWVRQLVPEVMVTMAYGRILPKELLEAPSLACLNIHASVLPRHRGASPIQAAIASGDRTSGVTIMHMAEGLDTGDVILEKSIPLARRETAGSLSEKLANLAPLALSEALERLSRGNAPRFQQDHVMATVTGKIGREESLLDWSQPAVVLEQKIRSLQPRPAAVATLPASNGEAISLKIHSAILARKASGKPGSILRVDERGVLVACGDGGLLLRMIQPEGKARMHSAAFARGRALKTGP
ncbi:MAG: methionyl-tRNA formyltransferase [Chthoniobacterales bacterium]|nr:methionyl-tRNA formyltransferase [Chthoniobacterales bacterium]